MPFYPLEHLRRRARIIMCSLSFKTKIFVKIQIWISLCCIKYIRYSDQAKFIHKVYLNLRQNRKRAKDIFQNIFDIIIITEIKSNNFICIVGLTVNFNNTAHIK